MIKFFLSDKFVSLELGSTNELLPEQPVGSVSSVGNVVKKHLQLLVIIKVCSDDCTNWGGGGKSSSCNVLRGEHIAIRFSCSKLIYVPHCPVLCLYPKFRVAALQEESVWSVPVAISDIRLSISVEVS